MPQFVPQSPTAMDAIRENKVELCIDACPGRRVELVTLDVGDVFSTLAAQAVMRQPNLRGFTAQRLDLLLLGGLPNDFNLIKQPDQGGMRIFNIQAENLGVGKQLDDLPEILPYRHADFEIFQRRDL